MLRPTEPLLVLTCALLLASATASLAEDEETAGDGASPAEWARVHIQAFARAWKPVEGHMRPLDDTGWRARMRALVNLVKIGDAATAPLVEALENEDPAVRAFAAQALGFLGDRSARDPLTRALKDTDAAVRLYAVDSLGKLGGLESAPQLEKLRKEDPNRAVRANTRFALERKGDKLDPSVRKELAAYDLGKLGAAAVGKKAPDFKLPDAAGQAYRLSDSRGKQHVVLVFVYGDT